jgi:hypothetical protein
MPGASWSCANPTIDVDVDPTGASSDDIDEYLAAINQVSAVTGRAVDVSEQPFSAGVVPAAGTIYVAWHPIDGLNVVSDLNPAWTVFLAKPAAGGTGPQILTAKTMFSHGLPEVAYFHEIGREFGLGDSPYATDDGFGGNFAVAGVPAEQPLSPGDIAGLRAGAPQC